jgi:hypothetical protein
MSNVHLCAYYQILKSLAETGTTHGHNNNGKQVVRYGDIIMLQHVKSGYFLSAFETAAAFDAECRSIKLVEEDSPQAMLKFLPRFKVRYWAVYMCVKISISICEHMREPLTLI